MNATSFKQSWSLWRDLLFQSQNSRALLRLFLGCTPMCKVVWDRIRIFSKLKVVCDIDIV